MKNLPDRHKLALGVGAATALLGAVWFIGALANPMPLSGPPLPHAQAGTVVKAAGQIAVPVPPQVFEQVTPQQAELINASVPLSTLPNPAAKPFALTTASSTDRNWALTCLTMAVYYEAASQSDQGQAAVAQVVLNRLRNPLFPKTVCGVVFQGSTLPTGCQFTFTCDGSLNRHPSQAGWARARQIAQRALDGYVEKSVGEATHYHTIWVVPYWQSTVVKVAQIGAHVFYRWNGSLGTPAAFQGQYAGLEPAPASIRGFDTGAELASITGLETTPAPKPATVVLPEPVAVAPPPPPVQVAMLAPAVTPAAVGKIEPVGPEGFFGHQRAPQHLAVAAHW